MDSGTAVMLVSCTATCLWLRSAVAGLAKTTNRKAWLHTLGATTLLVLLGTSALVSEMVIRDVAGKQYVEPSKQLEAAYAASSSISATSGAYTAGVLETAFSRNRGLTVGIAISGLVAAAAGFIAGRRSKQHLAASDSAPSSGSSAA
jgi:hypothetical protein